MHADTVSPPPGAHIGAIVGGRFRVDELIAEGGMGRVYRATEVTSRSGAPRPIRRVALKFIHPSLAADPSFIAHFERETETAAALQHPNVVPVFGIGEHEGSPFIAMAWIDGDDLGSLLARFGPMSPQEVVRLLWPIASALDSAHDSGLVHCDVKPGNVLVSRRGDVYLTDFGLAAPFHALVARPASRTVIGSASSMAPELVRRDPVDPGLARRIDVYGLACTAYACLTGGPPFRGRTDSVLRAHAFGQPPRVTGHRPDLPVEVDAVLRRALDKDPAARPPSCRAVLSQLADAARPRPAPIVPASVPAARVVAPVPPAAAPPPRLPPAVPPAVARVPPATPRASAGFGGAVPHYASRAGSKRRPSLVRAAIALAVLWAALLALQPIANEAEGRGDDGTRQADPEAALLAQVPAAAECEPAETGARELAAVSCLLDGARAVGYAVYGDLGSLRDDWAARVERAGFEPDSTLGCQLGDGETAWHLPSEPLAEPGRILCFGDEAEGTTIEWTDERHLVRGYVVSVGDMDAAREVWRRAFLA